ncbi:MAG: zinc carboxypeptidase, partial [Bacteroidota bacterium]
WRPNVLTDHHEMGTNATFFFMPGEPTRVYPGTPAINQELTKKIGNFHADALDEIGSLYYSGEGYDDYYIGKGSTYPDMQGTVGILFEQGSSRGHVQESENGLLTFPFTIRNQVATSLSTQQAFVSLRDELLKYQRDFYRKSKTEKGGYVIDGDGDPGRLKALGELLQRHDIAIKQYGDLTPTGLYVPLDQVQHQLVKAFFEPISEFEDSLFYDVSTWTLPYAFNLPTRKTASPPGDFMPFGGMGEAEPVNKKADYAYLLPWDDYYAPKAAYMLMDKGLRVKVSHKPFTGRDGIEYDRGTLMIPAVNQGEMTTDEVYAIIQEVEAATGLDIIDMSTGTVNEGLMMGSRSAYTTMEKPEVLLLVGSGINNFDAGEVWHLLDQRFDMPVTKMELGDVAYADLDRYNVIVMADGRYNDLGSEGVANLKDWMDYGKTLVTSKRAAIWASSNGLASIKTRSAYDASGSDKERRANRRPYEMASRDRGGKVLGGSIFQAEGDLTHPLLYGFNRKEVPVFRRGTLMFEPSQNDYATPLVYSQSPFLSGYVPKGFNEKLAGSAAIVVSGANGGRTICFADNPNFRAFWYGTNRLFMNAIFFGNSISSSTIER